MTDAAPTKRGPGRPRKTPATPPSPPVAEIVEPGNEPERPKPDEKPADERIGEQVDAEWRHVSFSDGREYRCEGGRIVERVG